MGLKQISGNTQIVFTVKTFVAFIGALLGLFYGFYQLVVVPRMNATDAMIIEQKEQNKITAGELIKINTSIGTLNGTLQVLVQEKTNNQTTANTGGSFGGGNSSHIANGTTASIANH